MSHFGYENYVKITAVGSYTKMEDILYSDNFERAKANKGIKGFWMDENWTYMYDPELIDPTDTEAIIKSSRMLDREIHCFISEPSSGTFVYSKYNDVKSREVFYLSNKLVDNVGNKLQEETSLDLSESISEEKLVEFSQLLGLDILGTKHKGNYIIGELDISSQMLNTDEDKIQAVDTSNKWWKLW